MADEYKVSLGVELNQNDLNNIRSTLDNLRTNGIEIRIDSSNIRGDISSVVRQMQQGGAAASNGFARGFNEGMSSIRIEANNAANTIQRLRQTLASSKFNSASIDLVTRDLEQMDIAVTNVVHRIRNNNLRLNVTGTDELGRTVTVLKEINLATGQITNIGKNISQSFGRTREEAKQVNSAYREMKSLIKEIANTSMSIDKARESGQGFDALEQKLISLNARYDELEVNFAHGFDTNQIRNLSNEWENAVHSINIANEAMANTAAHNQMQAEIRETEQSLQRFVSVAKQIDDINFQINKLDSNSNENEISVLISKLKELEQTYESLRTELSGRLPSGQLASVSESAFETAAKIEQLKAKIKDARNNLGKKIELKLETGHFAKQVKVIESDATKFKVSTGDIKRGIAEVNKALFEMKAAANNGDMEALIKANERYEKRLKSVRNQLQINAREEKNAVDMQKLADDREIFQSKIDAWLTKNSAATKKFGSEMLRLKAQAESCDRVQLDHLKKEFQQLDKAAEAAGLKTQSFSDRIKSQFARYKDYLSVAFAIQYVTQGLKDMFEQVVAIDTAMIELKKVTDESDETYNKFLTNAASKSKEIGTTVDGLITSTADFARLGYGFKDAQGLAEVANIYAVVGDEIEGVEEATQSLVSTLTAFKDEMNGMSDSDFALSIVDKFNEVSNNFAISSGGIGEALTRSASSMAAANNTLDETIALITAANTVVQDPDAVGTAFKTISMRIRGAKTELEAAGLETDGMVDSTAKLREEIMALSGVDIMLNDNEFKSTYAIIEELANKWQDLTDIQQATVTELIAGKRQGNIISSLMENFDVAQQALETSLNSSGSAMAEHEKWQQSLEARINKLKAAWQSLSQSFLSSDFLKSTLDAIVGLIDGIDKLISKAGTFPTLLTGFSLFNSLFNRNGILNIFEIFDNDLDGITNKVGLLGKSFADLSEAFNFGKTGNGFKGFFRGLQSVGNLFKSNALSKSDLSSLQSYNDLIDQCVGSQTAWYRTMQDASPAAQNLVAKANGGKVAMQGLTVATKASTVATIGMKVAVAALNAVLVMGVTWAISSLIKWFDEWYVSADELAEKINEVTASYKEQHDSLMKLKGDYDTSNESSMISKYGKLSKGVNALGENISLTADEYSEYQSIVDTIAGQIPSLVSGYNSQGDAILSCADDVDKLTEAYKNLIREQNNKVLDSGEDYFKDFKNDLEGTSAFFRETKTEKSGRVKINEYVDHYNTEHFKQLENLMNLSDRELEEAINNLSHDEITRLSGLLDEQGFEINLFGSGEKGWETQKEHIIRAITTDTKEVKNILNKAKADLDAHAEDLGTATNAYFSNAFLGDYSHFGERMQNAISQVVSGFDSEFYIQFLEDENPYESFTKYLDSILASFDSLSDVNAEKFEAAFDLKTKFNGGKISYGEYVKGIKEAGQIVDSMGLADDVEHQIKLNLGLSQKGNKWFVEEYETLLSRLTSKEYGIQLNTKDAEEFINGLTSSEYSVALDLVTSGEVDLSNFDLDSLRKYIEEQAKLQDALKFTIAIDVEAESVEALNTAMAESVSATGLSSESIKALKSRYAELEDQGYDLSSMFEETSNGVHLNRKAVNELEKAYASDKLEETDSKLKVLKGRYDELTDEIKNCSDVSERASLYREQQTIVQKINDLGTLAAQYEGLTSSYNAWLNAEESGSERDMYEGIIEGWENIGDEISRGWVDDGTREFLKLIKGEKATIVDANGVKKEIDLATASAKELKQVWKDFDKDIEHTTYSISDFFTVDEDGNSTSQGVYNFLDAIGQMEEEEFGGKDVVKRDSKGNIIGFDFQLVGGDEVIAEALGVSEELVQIMKRTAADAGFVVRLDGSWTQFADLTTEAEEANQKLKKLSQTNKELKNAGFGEYDFNFETSNVETLNTDLEKAKELLNSDAFKDPKTGKFNINAEGAKDALLIAETLQIAKSKAEEPIYMSIDASELQDDLQKPVSLLQQFETLTQEKDLLNLTGTDTKRLGEIDTELNNIVDSLYSLDEETKVKLGIDGMTPEEIRKELENGTIEIPTELTIEANMDKSLEDLVTLGLLEQGLITEKEAKIRLGLEVSEVDTSQIEEELDKTELTEDQKVQILAVAEVLGAEDVDELTEKLNGLTDEQIQVLAEVLGRVDVEKLKKTVNGLDDKTVEAIAKALGEGDVEGLRTTIMGLDDKTVQAIAKAFGYDNVDELDKAIVGMDDKTVQAIANALGITDVDSLRGAVNRLTDNNVTASASVSGKTEVDNLNSSIDTLKGKDGTKITITTFLDTVKRVFNQVASGGKKKAAQRTGAGLSNYQRTGTGYSEVNGTAFKQGSWGTKNSGTALVGELGRETLVRDGRYYTIGNDGAEFIKYQRGDIIFNHKQTEELFRNGRVTSGGGRAKAFGNGTAFANGSYPSSGAAFSKEWDGYGEWIAPEVKSLNINYNYNSKDSDKSQELFDWIEVAIERIEREINNLDKTANNVYKSWSERNNALNNEIGAVRNEIELQKKAIAGYQQALNEISLPQEYVNKIKYGAIDIDNITDEALAEKISDYQKWYEKILECIDAIQQLEEDESDLFKQQFDNIATRYEGMLSIVEHEKNMLEEYISQSEAQGWLVSGKYYDALIDNEKESISKLQAEKSELLAELNSGNIARGTEAWYEMVNTIDEVTLAIAESQTAILEYQQTLQQLDWEVFDLIQDRISAVTEEADFLIELMSNKKLYDDNGEFTDEGMATMGLRGQNYNVYMHLADDAAAEAERIKAQMARDPWDTELEERYREMISLQQEHILAAEGEKEAIRDMVEEGIEFELDALQERIDLYNDALDSQKDLYDYQRKVKEQTKEIAALEKQMAAYANDDSEETKAKVQEIKVALEEARLDLEETEYDKYIADQQKLLDDLYLEYETVLNSRLDNIDALLAEMIAEINADASLIGDTIRENADAVGVTLSTAMETTWNSSAASINGVITSYGEQFNNAQTTTNSALNAIKLSVQTMVSSLNTLAAQKAASAAGSSAGSTAGGGTLSNVPVVNNNSNNNNSGGDGVAKVGDKVKFISGEYYYDSYGTKPLGAYNRGKYVYITAYNPNGTHPYHISTGNKLHDGDLGWLKLSQLSGYAVGKKNFADDEVAWTQEGRKQEFIVRPSDGAILTPIAKGDSVLNAAASNNIWDMANNPSEFIKDNLKLDAANVPNNMNSQSVYNQTIENVTFDLKNVKNYEELLAQMQKDKNFERLISSMTIDRLAGKSSLAKGKAIR